MIKFVFSVNQSVIEKLFLIPNIKTLKIETHPKEQLGISPHFIKFYNK